MFMFRGSLFARNIVDLDAFGRQGVLRVEIEREKGPRGRCVWGPETGGL